MTARLTIRDIAERTGASACTVTGWIRSGELPAGPSHTHRRKGMHIDIQRVVQIRVRPPVQFPPEGGGLPFWNQRIEFSTDTGEVVGVTAYADDPTILAPLGTGEPNPYTVPPTPLVDVPVVAGPCCVDLADLSVRIAGSGLSPLHDLPPDALRLDLPDPDAVDFGTMPNVTTDATRHDFRR